MKKRAIVHVDISATNTTESAEFYQTVFGWEHHTSEDYNYTMFGSGNDGGGGYIQVGENGVKQGDIVLFIDSDDIEADLTTIESNGGKRLSEKMVIEGFGEMAYFSDPGGNKVGLWKSTNT